MTAVATPAAPTRSPATPTAALRSFLATRPVWLVGLASTAVGAVVTTLVAVAAKAADVPMQAAPRTAETTSDLPMAMFPVSVLMCGAVGVLLAVALHRWARRPARTFVVATVLLTIVSFSGPVTTGHATTATRVVLELTHVVAAAVIIPAIAYRLARRPAR